jgi:hypothetical protein
VHANETTPIQRRAAIILLRAARGKKVQVEEIDDDRVVVS